MIKTLASQIKQYKRAAIMTPIFVLLEVAMEMMIPRLMASIVDQGVEAGNLGHIYKTGGIMLLIALVGLFAGIMAGRTCAYAAAGFAHNLRQTMYRNIQTFSFSNIDKFSTSGLVTRLTTDVTSLQTAFQMGLRMCTRAPASMIVAMIMAFTISPKLASIYLVAVILLGIVLGTIVVKATKYFMSVFPKYDDLNASVQENVSAIRVVKAYVREDHEKEKFNKASSALYKLFVSAEKIVAFNRPVMDFTVYSCILLISWIGAKMVVSSTLSTGNLMSLLTYCMNILMSLMMLSMIFVMITMSVASARRICEVINEQADLVNPENPDYTVPDGSIEFRNVCFAYRKDSDRYVLRDVNLSICSGETIGIIGGTGSSKTSLVNLISRLYDVSEGAVLVGGKDVRSYDLDTLRKEVSVVLQKNVLFSGTVMENLRWGNPQATLEDCVEACRLACADEFISKMPEGYDSHVERGGANLSGGQRQRLCIARALMRKPKILILDDSTSAVDTATDARIRKAFAEQIPDTTKLIIAQRIASIEGCDRILVMDNGMVSGFGTHAELLENNPIYRDVYESQIGSSDNDDLDIGGED